MSLQPCHSVTIPRASPPGGFALRPETPADTPFLAALFASVRGPEFAGNGWPEEALRAFLADQFRLQTLHYARYHAGAAFFIVERRGTPVGRFCLHRGERDHRIVDISLLAEARNQGMGGALLDWACAEAAALGRSVSLQVEAHNPACRLYARKGFVPTDETGPFWQMTRAAPAAVSAGML
ncbi:N-acetyltransferase family protein [Ancylobacter sp. IITR112]|uniref:GNAT family N-acetyltransferase n=1 Tax=Ancylobacter sp. IITR112 TaxID=3138073 RepID=UPI00352B3AB1